MITYETMDNGVVLALSQSEIELDALRVSLVEYQAVSGVRENETFIASRVEFSDAFKSFDSGQVSSCVAVHEFAVGTVQLIRDTVAQRAPNAKRLTAIRDAHVFRTLAVSYVLPIWGTDAVGLLEEFGLLKGATQLVPCSTVLNVGREPERARVDSDVIGERLSFSAPHGLLDALRTLKSMASLAQRNGLQFDSAPLRLKAIKEFETLKANSTFSYSVKGDKTTISKGTRQGMSIVASQQVVASLATDANDQQFMKLQSEASQGASELRDAKQELSELESIKAVASMYEAVSIACGDSYNAQAIEERIAALKPRRGAMLRSGFENGERVLACGIEYGATMAEDNSVIAVLEERAADFMRGAIGEYVYLQERIETIRYELRAIDLHSKFVLSDAQVVTGVADKFSRIEPAKMELNALSFNGSEQLPGDFRNAGAEPKTLRRALSDERKTRGAIEPRGTKTKTARDYAQLDWDALRAPLLAELAVLRSEYATKRRNAAKLARTFFSSEREERRKAQQREHKATHAAKLGADAYNADQALKARERRARRKAEKEQAAQVAAAAVAEVAESRRVVAAGEFDS